MNQEDVLRSMADDELEQHLTERLEGLSSYGDSTEPQDSQESELKHFISCLKHLSSLGRLPSTFQRYLN